MHCTFTLFLRFFLVSAFIFSGGYVKAQLVADFSADVTKGCVPLPDVKFTDLSTGPRSIVSRLWTFGNGNISNSNDTGPRASYPNAGLYTVSLTVSDGVETKTVTKTGFIQVFRAPTANFSSNSQLTGCIPLQVSFNDLSTEGDGRINQWYWSFGDGRTSILQNPLNTYVLQSDFPVSLTVTDTNNCTASKQINAFVRTSDKPNIQIALSATSPNCSVPYTVAFTNNTMGSGNLTYSWSFGDGAVSSAASPTHTYIAFGSYTISLTATDAFGCTATYIKPDPVVLAPLIAAFSLPLDTLCINTPFTAINQSIAPSGVTYRWDFGDGAGSTAKNGAHAYTTPGNHIITLYIYSGSACVDSVKKTITAIMVKADFSVNKRYLCQPNKEITYTGLSQFADSVKWLLGDTTNLRRIISGNTRTRDITVRFYTEGSFSDTLVAYNRFGCNDTLILNNHILVSLMHPVIESDKEGGCAPVTFQLTDKTFPQDTVVSRLWTFGDGTTSTLANPTYTLNQVGTQNVILTVTNASGCSSSVSIDIMAGIKPVPSFVLSDSVVCASEFVEFTSTSTPADSITRYYWSFDMSFNGPKVFHQFFQIGYIDIELIVSDRGCMDSLTKYNALLVKGPVVVLAPFHSCADPWNFYRFTGYPNAANKLYWDFGDSTGIVTDTIFPSNQTHTYAQSGDYYVKVSTDTVDGCSFTYTYPNSIKVRNIKAAFSADKYKGCAWDWFTFTSGSQDVAAEFWYSNNDTMDSTTYRFTEGGVYSIKLVATDDNSCRDSVTRQIQVYKPKAAYVISDSTVCVGTQVQFTDRSHIGSDTTIVSRQWHFGLSTSTAANPAQAYVSPGIYPVRLIATDILGCTDTLLRDEQVWVFARPLPHFDFLGDGKLCVGDAETFVHLDPDTSNIVYLWDFGDGGTSVQKRPTHIYTQPGKFDVSLQVSRQGCVVDTLLNDFIEVQKAPDAGFITSQHRLVGQPFSPATQDSIVVTCYPFTLNFIDTAANAVYSKWTWGIPGSLGGGDTVSAQYIRPGIYDVMLIDSSSFGCSDTLIKKRYIQVKGPVAYMSLAPSEVCTGNTVSLQLDSSQNAFNFLWDFGDGRTQSGGAAPSHKYTYEDTKSLPGRQIQVSLIYSNQDGSCQKSDSAKVTVHFAKSNILLSDTSICKNEKVMITDSSFSTTPGVLNYYYWSFDPVRSSAVKDPGELDYTVTGTFTVQHIVASDKGCRDTAYKNIIVHPPPAVNLFAGTLKCQGDTAQLTAIASGSQSYQYEWIPAISNSSNVYNPVITLYDNTQYTVKVTDEHSCTAANSVNIVVQKPPVVAVKTDTSVIIGQNAYPDFYQGEGYTYAWTPPEGLSCTDCPNPVIRVLEPRHYKVVVTDTNKCFAREGVVFVDVLKDCTVDVPTAFTPNGDGKNDIIYVRGWGIKRLVEFKIYNRWGQVVFFSDKLEEGWNGYYRGELQNVESYVFTVVVENYLGETHTRKGYISLLR